MRKLAIVALAAGVLLTMVAIRVADLSRWRAQTLKTAEGHSANLALILSEYLREMFATGDASLRQLTIHSRRIGGPSAPARDWMPSLTSAKAGLTGVGSLSVVDRDGVIVHSTLPSIVGQSRRDDYVFHALAAAHGDDLAIDRPYMSVNEPRQFIIPIGRRLVDEHGGFAGAIVATFNPAVPRGFLTTVDVGRRGIIWVFHPDGVVLFREPSGADPIGQGAADNPVFAAALRRGPAGLLAQSLTAGGPVFLTAFRVTTTPPLVVAVSLDRGEVLTEWRNEAAGSAAVFAVVALLLAATLVVLYRQMDEKAAAERALLEAQELEAAHLREANDRLASALEREQRARRDAEAASALKDQFLMTISHELRTPLTAIYGWARMLVDGVVSDRRRDAALRTIERNAHAQTRLIDDLLDVSRAMAGKLRLDVRPVDAGDVVRNAVETVRPAADAKGVRIEMAIDPAAGCVSGDPERLQQIVWNLLSNAVKFSAVGGHVGVSVARDGAELEIAVADAGVGISAEFLPHVFERFRQEDAGSTRRYGGLGLGLAIVRNLVELHGGSVSAQSDGQGHGSTFRVRLPSTPPVVAAAPAAANRPLVRARSRDAGARLDGVRVLVVDDAPEACELFANILETAGATVTCATSAEEAMDLLRSAPQDVMVSDIEMPDVDGYALVSQALALSAGRRERLMTIAVTAYSRPGDAARSLAAGFDRHVRKPVDPADLIAAVHAVRSAVPDGA